MAKIIRTDKWSLSPTKYQLPVLENTVDIYRDMVRRLISIVNLRWKEIAAVEAQRTYQAPGETPGVLSSQRYVEQLFHQTKDNPNPKFGKFFGLGTKLYKFPSYLRRAAINDAIGHVSSFHTRYYDWQSGIRKSASAKPPVLNISCGVYPDLYKNQCIKIATDYSKAEIKVYKNNDWRWEVVKISSLSRRHLIPGVKQLSPTLVVRNGVASLSVPYWIPKVNSNQTDRYCGLDLGINTTAVCSIIDESGMVHARQFIHDGKSLDKRDKHLARISRKARLTKRLHKGFAKSHYRKAANINKNIASETAKQIITFAIANDATTVVIENLRNWKPKGGKRKSSLKQRFHGWVKGAIADRLEQLGQEHGIKIVSVYARGTSSTAYDGTGKVRRDKDNYALGSFSTKKRYSIDLSASYNIAARHIAHKLKLATKHGKLLVSQNSGSKPRSWVSLSSLWYKTTNGDEPDTTTTMPQGI